MALSDSKGVAFTKGSAVLAHLYGESKRGTFACFDSMVVTEAGRAAGYTNLQKCQDVYTPHAKTLRGNRTQLPVRSGMVFGIMLGYEKTAEQKSSSLQQRLLCLTLVQKESSFSAGVTDAEGQCFA